MNIGLAELLIIAVILSGMVVMIGAVVAVAVNVSRSGRRRAGSAHSERVARSAPSRDHRG